MLRHITFKKSFVTFYCYLRVLFVFNFVALGFHPRSENSFFALTQVERANTSMSYMPPLNTAKPTVQLPKRPKTAAANLQKQQIEKTALKVEKPFR